jgi:hypothetical protein
MTDLTATLADWAERKAAEFRAEYGTECDVVRYVHANQAYVDATMPVDNGPWMSRVAVSSITIDPPETT